MVVMMSGSFRSVSNIFFLDPFFLTFRTNAIDFHAVMADLETGQIFGNHLHIIQYRIIEIDDFPATF